MVDVVSNTVVFMDDVVIDVDGTVESDSEVGRDVSPVVGTSNVVKISVVTTVVVLLFVVLDEDETVVASVVVTTMDVTGIVLLLEMNGDVDILVIKVLCSVVTPVVSLVVGVELTLVADVEVVILVNKVLSSVDGTNVVILVVNTDVDIMVAVELIERLVCSVVNSIVALAVAVMLVIKVVGNAIDVFEIRVVIS